MPGGDGTGPMGMGRMTGRVAGYCAGYPAPGFMNPVGGGGFRGWGRGRGWGRRHRHWFCATGVPGWARYGMAVPPPQVAPQQEIEALKAQAGFFEDALNDIRACIQEIEAEAKKK